MHMYSTITTKYFILELISDENLACHLRLSYTNLDSNDNLDSFWQSRINDFQTICFQGVPCMLVISTDGCLLYLTSVQCDTFQSSRQFLLGSDLGCKLGNKMYH